MKSEKTLKKYFHAYKSSTRLIITKSMAQTKKKLPSRKKYLSKKQQLSKSDIQSILEQTGLLVVGVNKQLKKETVQQIKKLTYDPKYESCWDGKPQSDLWSQALSKVQCFLKYGDKF